MPSSDSSPPRRFRAPRGDGGALVDPPWPDLPALVRHNRAYAASLDYDFGGVPLADLRADARRRVLDASLEHTRGFCDAPPPPPDASLILSGHQPELFHAGVWFKNFALSALARQTGAAGVHLIIDSDHCSRATVRVPTGPVDAPRVEATPIDRFGSDLPYEERAIVDRDTLASFPDRAERALDGLVAQPLVRCMWPDVLRAADRTRNLGLAVSHARRRLEERWGAGALETPVSQVCDAPPFWRFAACLLARLPEFRAAHNGALAEYRAAHRIRTPAQPMPDLHREDGWQEAPLWVWTTEDPRRRALYARPEADGLTLSDRARGQWRLEARPDGALDTAVEQLAELRASGVKFRPRALITTLFARLCVADLFLHGIGGSTYDQATSRLAERFFGFALPPNATLSATFRLPIEHEPADPDLPRSLSVRLRELTYHPERFVTSPDGAAAVAVAEKTRWVHTEKTPANAGERHHGIAHANRSLQPHVAEIRTETEQQLAAAAARRRAATVLESREYSFCLFPQDWLRPRMLGLLGD